MSLAHGDVDCMRVATFLGLGANHLLENAKGSCCVITLSEQVQQVLPAESVNTKQQMLTASSLSAKQQESTAELSDVRQQKLTADLEDATQQKLTAELSKSKAANVDS